MEYHCKTMPVDKLIAGPAGFVTPLCENCKTEDCTNPIEQKKISIVGMKKLMKLYVRGDTSHFVVACQGFTK